MATKLFQNDRPHTKDISWCPGCGNFQIRLALIDVLEELNFKPKNTVIITGIGQAAKMVHYLNANGFHTLHGRALPVGTGLKLANPNLNVIVIGGDGDMYAEGMGHFIHAIRRNVNITVLIHNNQIYGLTKGQTSPTSLLGMKTSSNPEGVIEAPINPLALAISLDCSFVARTFIGYKDETKNILKEAITHKGFSMVDIFQQCVTFNKLNTYKWYKENTKFLGDINKEDRLEAYKYALSEDPFYVGIFYKKDKKPLDEQIECYKKTKLPLYKRNFDKSKLEKFIDNNFKI
ncbi:MAG: thiamine pyrophosphate-dependent enzyme [Deferribacterota bacterium]|nr:thiamine pyrophosphate-dependent enzyme [Deferribacterota bacterium]